MMSTLAYSGEGLSDGFLPYVNSCSIDLYGFENINNKILVKVRKNKISQSIYLNFDKPNEEYIQKSINKKILLTNELYLQIIKNKFTGNAIYLLFYKGLEDGIAFTHFTKEEIYDELKCLAESGILLSDLDLEAR